MTGIIEHVFDDGWAAVAEEPRPAAAPAWSSWVPGPELAAGLAASEPLDLVVDEGYDAVERLAAWEALASWAIGRGLRETGEYLQARQARVQGAGQAELVAEAVGMEVATLARVAPRTGELRVHQAVTLCEQLPATLAALETGRIALSHVRVVLEQTELCDASIARAVDAELWSRPGRDRTPSQLRDLVRRIVARLDPDLVRRRPEQAARDRELRYWSDDHGATGVLQLRLPADEARGVWAVVDAAAHRAGDPPEGEKRNLDQKRADTARDLLLDGATARGAAGGAEPCCRSCADQHDGVTGHSAGDDPRGEDPARDDPAVEDPAGDDPRGEDPARDDPAGEDPAGDDPRGEDPARDDPAGEEPAGEDPAREDSPGEDAPTDERGPAAGGRAAPLPERDPVRGVLSGTRSPVRPEVRLTIGWDVLAGFSDRPGELEGHGPIPAPMARRLAAEPEAWWRRLFTDPVTGTAVHLDARRYRPPAGMAEFVRARDMTCAAPGCRVPAARCDLDHVVPYDHHRPGGGAGPTRADQLRPACRRHHNLKTHAGWRTELGPDPEGGSAPVIVWTSPSGHRWWVRSPSLEPPPWDRDPDEPSLDRRPSDDPPVGGRGDPGERDPGERDPGERPGERDPGERDPGERDAADWPPHLDSWRRREADPRAVDPWRGPV